MSESHELEPAELTELAETVEVEVVEAEAELAEKPKKRSAKTRPTPPPTAPAVLGKKSYDDVKLSAVIYKNNAAKRSMTVWHLQRRLAEWGHIQGLGDRSGYYGDPTSNAVLAFQKALGLRATGLMDAETFERVFEGDTNVKVSLT